VKHRKAAAKFTILNLPILLTETWLERGSSGNLVVSGDGNTIHYYGYHRTNTKTSTDLTALSAYGQCVSDFVGWPNWICD
jgi:hypothetical protein